jgi:RNA polymerase-binding transcription factor DksA
MIEVTPAGDAAADNGHSEHRQLETERERLTRLIAGLECEGLDLESEFDSIGELAPVSQHQADLASETFERERDLSLLGEFRAELNEVERALARLADGSYGLCAHCRAPIGDERLTAVPATRYCRTCQARHERLDTLESEAAYATEGIVGDLAEFLPSDDELESSAEAERAAEEQAVAEPRAAAGVTDPRAVSAKHGELLRRAV